MIMMMPLLFILCMNYQVRLKWNHKVLFNKTKGIYKQFSS